MKRNVLILTFAAMVFALPVWAGNGYILKKGKEYPLCREMIQILNLPENAHSLSYRTVGKEFTIPKKYKNFQTIDWKQPTKEELAKYVSPQSKQIFELIKERALKIEKDWDGKGDFVFEVAKVDIDRDDKSLETVLHYRLPNWKQSSCMFADTEPEGYRKALNPQTASEWLGRQCTLFKYGGRTYFTWGELGLIVNKPISSEGAVLPLVNGQYTKYPRLYLQEICEIENPNWRSENPQPKGISK